MQARLHSGPNDPPPWKERGRERESERARAFMATAPFRAAARGKKARKKQLWQEFFSDPSQWWDNRLNKKNSGDPDFKHKLTLEVLWIDGWLNPPGVKEKIANMALNQMQSSGRLTSWPPTSFGNYDKIQKLSEEGRLEEALKFLELLAAQSCEAYKGAFVCLLRACTRKKALAEGKELHALIVRCNCDRDIFLSNLLVEMYSSCDSPMEAYKVFTAMTQRNVFSWIAMISAYTNSGRYKDALMLFQQMQQTGVELNKYACVVVLKACTSIAALEQGQQLHTLIVKKGFDSDIIIQTSLIDMYAKCGCLKDAYGLFTRMPQRDVVSWNAMITAYAQKGLGKESLDLYKQMKCEGMEPNKVTLVVLLKACAGISALEQGKQLHSLILQKGLDSQVIIQTSLIDMYAKCGCLEYAHELFNNMSQRNVVSWNVMIAGYAQRGLGKEALDLYEKMKHEGMEPNLVTLVLLLKACASISALEQGMQLHSLILQKGLEYEKIIQTTLVDMYAKCGSLKDACELFNKMSHRDVISWSAMIGGYVQKGLGKEALDLHEQMMHEGVEPDSITLVLLVNACASVSALEQGQQLHSLILNKGLESEITIQNALVDMYAKCGCIQVARELFNNIPQRTVVSWSAMIAGYAQRGLGKEALNLYEQMKQEGLRADKITYTCVLSACCHSGLVDEGRHVFESMLKDRDVTPTLEHYGCMVDLLGRAGFVADAEDFVLKMPIQPDEVVWMSLLGAARKYVNVEIGKHAFKRVLKLKSEQDAAPYLLLIDIYSAAGRMNEVAELRKEMKDKGLEKSAGVQLD